MKTYVKIPKDVFERVLRDIKRIETMDKAAERYESTEPVHGYAYALGACNGIAACVAIDLEVYAK